MALNTLVSCCSSATDSTIMMYMSRMSLAVGDDKGFEKVGPISRVLLHCGAIYKVKIGKPTLWNYSKPS